MSVRDKEKALNIALYRMSAKTRECIKDVLDDGSPVQQPHGGQINSGLTPADKGNEEDRHSNVLDYEISAVFPTSSGFDISCEDQTVDQFSPVTVSVDGLENVNDNVAKVVRFDGPMIVPELDRISERSAESVCSNPRDGNFNQLLQVEHPLYGSLFDRPSSEMGYYKKDYDSFARAPSIDRPKTASCKLPSYDSPQAREERKTNETTLTHGNMMREKAYTDANIQKSMTQRSSYHERVVLTRPSPRFLAGGSKKRPGSGKKIMKNNVNLVTFQDTKKPQEKNVINRTTQKPKSYEKVSKRGINREILAPVDGEFCYCVSDC